MDLENKFPATSLLRHQQELENKGIDTSKMSISDFSSSLRQSLTNNPPEPMTTHRVEKLESGVDKKLSKAQLIVLAKEKFNLDLKSYQTKKQMHTSLAIAQQHINVHNAIERCAR